MRHTGPDNPKEAYNQGDQRGEAQSSFASPHLHRSHITLLHAGAVLSWILALLLGTMLVAGCQPSRQKGLYVAAAASLAQTLPDLQTAFTAQTGIPVIPVFSSSGNLTQQIINGAPYDVFLSADEQYIEALIQGGYIRAESKRVYALGTLALVTSTRHTPPITGMTDLIRPEIRRVAIANPQHAPYGRAAVEALQRTGVWESITHKLVIGENVRQALQFVQTGNADAGIVARSLLPVSGIHVQPVPTAWHSPIVQTAGILRRSSRLAEARQFLDFLLSPTGQRILQEHGFTSPEAVP